MTTISIVLKENLNNYLDEQVKLGKASSKADLISRAIIKYKEDDFIATIAASKQEIAAGQVLSGDLNKLAADVK